MKTLLLLLVLSTFFLPASSQNPIGLPEIVNFSKHTFRGGAQTRQITQDKKGIMYFANDEGVLTYNGSSWKIYALPNKSLVRSIEIGKDNRLYVGGQDELGYFSPSKNGDLVFHSLKHLLPKDARSVADVWEICESSGKVFFQTSSSIYEFDGSGVIAYPDPHWRFMGMMDDRVVAQSANRGLLVFHHGQWQPLVNGPTQLPADYFATSFTTIGKDSVLLTTLKNGFYLYQNHQISKMQSPLLDNLAAKNVSSSRMLNNRHLAIGTNLDGCFVIDKNGNLVGRFGKEEGLQNNSVLGVFLDRHQNMWLGLHNGIDFIPYNNAVKHIHPDLLDEGSGFTSHLYNGELYIGTSIGLFKAEVNGNKQLADLQSTFRKIEGTEGEAWNLSEVNGSLLLGHNDGAFLVMGNRAVNLDKKAGYWNFQSPATRKDIMLAGSYNGIEFFRQNGPTFSKVASSTIESARFVVVSGKKVWFSHPYKGVYAVAYEDTSAAIKKYSLAEGLLSDHNNYLFSIRGKLLLTAEAGVFEYDQSTDRFIPSAFYNQHLPKSPVRYLKEDKQGNVWFVFEKRIGVLDLTGTNPQLIYFPELTNKFVAGFEHINPIDENNILIGGEKGFYHLDYEAYKRLKYPLDVRITSVSSLNMKDSLLFGGYGSHINTFDGAGNANTFNAAFNSFRFEFASAVYGQASNVEYSYTLDGFDRSWSDYTKKTEKEYTNLPPGSYTFKVKARNNLGNVSPEESYSFTVLPPWYRTRIAYVFYLIIAGLLLYLLYVGQKKKFRHQQQRHEEEQQKLQYLHQLEMDKAEKELIQLRNEKLEIDLQVKTTELASASMHLVQKSEVLLKVKEQMKKLNNAPANGNGIDLKKILKTLNEEDKMEEQWQQFSIHFDAVHHNFLATLKKRHPQLTPNDHKLCAYLKMNLTTKEIAQLMNISVRGVEISRYRLRKKLEVPNGVHLFNFLDAVHGGENGLNQPRAVSPS